MSEFLSFPGIDPPSPTLAARLREMADYFAAPTVGRLTEEQRALSLGIARRLIFDVGMRLDSSMDTDRLWDEWLYSGLPCAARIADLCFSRAEEHRWREQSAHRVSPAPILSDPDGNETKTVNVNEPLSDVDRAYLALRISDRRRFDTLGQPTIAIADLDPEIFRALLLDIAAQRLAEVSEDRLSAAHLGDVVRSALDRQASEPGIAQAGEAYHDSLGAALPDAAAAAIARYDWPTLIALAAAANRRSYSAMAMTLLGAEMAALPSLLVPLRLDRTALAPLEASLALLPSRPVGDADYDHDHAAVGSEA